VEDSHRAVAWTAGVSSHPSTQRSRNPRDPRRIERLASRSARLFLALLIDSEHRKDLLPEGWKDVGKIFAVAVVLDVICQLIVLRWVYPGEALLVATTLAILPYLMVRGPVNRIASARTKSSDQRQRNDFTKKGN